MTEVLVDSFVLDIDVPLLLYTILVSSSLLVFG